jgi:hypothetical protein
MTAPLPTVAASLGDAHPSLATSPTGPSDEADRASNPLLQLARRCEQAAGPDRDLDVAITCAAYKWLKALDYILPAPSGNGRCVQYYVESGTHGTFGAPAYTRSIETILGHLVVGELCGFGVALHVGNRWTAEISTDQAEGYFRAIAATKELALCAATLRGRAAIAARAAIAEMSR